MVQLIDGKETARKLCEQLASDINCEKLKPGLAVVLVGNNPASQVYIRNKTKACASVGVQSFEYCLPAETTMVDLLALINKLNDDKKVHGILVQLPLPDHLSEDVVIEAISPTKDVDGFHPINIGRLYAAMPAFVPCTPQGSLVLIKEVMPHLSGKKALVVGRSTIVGKPMAQLLLQENCTVTMAHSRTVNLSEECLRADILVAAIGKPEFIQGDWIKEGAVVIDVGINRQQTIDGKGRLVGDVDFAAAAQRAAAITPVPGGVGPMTIACLLRNTVQAARNQRDL